MKEYSKTPWTNGGGEPINADNLNKIEQGILDAINGVNENAKKLVNANDFLNELSETKLHYTKYQTYTFTTVDEIKTNADQNTVYDILVDGSLIGKTSGETFNAKLINVSMYQYLFSDGSLFFRNIYSEDAFLQITDGFVNSENVVDVINFPSIDKLPSTKAVWDFVANKLADDLEIVKIGYDEDLSNYKDPNKLYYSDVGIRSANGFTLYGGCGNYVGFVKYIRDYDIWVVISFAGYNRGIFQIDSAGNVTPVADSEPKENSNSYITSSAVYNNSEYLKGLISEIPKFNIAVVNELPTDNISDTTIYLLPSGSDESNLYTEYIYVNNSWEKLGTQTVDLSDYVQKTDYATAEKAGLVKPGGGLIINEDGKLAGAILSAIEVHNADPQNVISAGSLREYFKYRSTTSISETPTDTYFSTEKAVYDFVSERIDELNSKINSITDYSEVSF